MTPLQARFLVEAFVAEQEAQIEADRRAAEDSPAGEMLDVRSQDDRSREKAAGGLGGGKPAAAKPKPHPVNKPIKKKTLTALAKERRGGTVGKNRKTVFKTKKRPNTR